MGNAFLHMGIENGKNRRNVAGGFPWPPWPFGGHPIHLIQWGGLPQDVGNLESILYWLVVWNHGML